MKSLNGVAVVAAWGVIAVASVAVNAVGQTTWTVCHDGTCDFASLQSAIDTAADGDVIQISAGTFTEAPIAIHNRDLTLAGSTLAATELSGSLTSRIISITGTSSVRLRDIRFIDGRAAGERGGAIAFYGLALDVDGCTFHNNHAGDGGAIFAEGGNLRVVASEFTNNAALGVSYPDGGAIKLAGTTATLVRCVFSNNTAGYSGGGVSQIAGSLWATSSVFDSNYAPLGGALEVYAHNFALTLVNCTLLNNVGQASSGSAVQAYYAQVRLVNTIVSGTGLLLRTLYGGGFTGAHSILSHGELAGWGNQVGDPILSDAYEPLPGSPCLDSGTNRLMPSEFDVDGSGSPCHAYAYDCFGSARFRDAGVSPVGITDCTDIRCHVDIGAIEADGTPAAAPRLADLTGDGAVGGDDLGVLLVKWGHSACIGDLNVDGIVDGLDLSDLLSSWIECK